MADIQPLTPKQGEKAAQADQPASDETENLSPQELEAKKAVEAGRKEEERQTHIDELIRSRKYFLPIKR